MDLDYAAHNAEQAEMWAAYRRREPTRVPIIFGINPRYTMWRPEANPTGIDFERYSTDPAAMMQRQLEHSHWVRHHLLMDTELGLPEAWGVYTDLQNCYEAAWFGCPIRYRAGQVPDTEPILGDDNKRLLFDRGIPDPFGGGLARAWELYDCFQARISEGYEFAGRPVRHASVTGLGTDGPVTVACNLRGATEFFSDLLADPDYAQELLAFIVEATITRIRAYRERLGQPMTTPTWGFADDSVALLSLAAWRELVLPHHRRLMTTFSEGGPNGMHLCGDATHLFLAMVEELNVGSFDTGFPVDFGALRRALGPDIEIHGGPSVPFLTHATPAAVREEVRRILGSGICEGGRFILREGNNLAPEVPVENVLAMYEAGREFGGY